MKKRALAALLALLLACAGPECQVAAAPMQDCPPAVALTFDDGPNGACTEALLRLLAEKDVPATFFLCGYRIAEQPDLAAQFGVMSIPTLLVFEQGKLVRQAVGARPKAGVLELLG